jgi:hypothetical protein
VQEKARAKADKKKQLVVLWIFIRRGYGWKKQAFDEPLPILTAVLPAPPAAAGDILSGGNRALARKMALLCFIVKH